jgi:hypothetical protein
MSTALRTLYPRRSEIARILSALRGNGITIGSIEISPDGAIRVTQFPTDLPSASNDFDRLDAAGLL